MKAAILIVFGVVLYLAVFWEDPEPRTAPGVLAPFEPEQEEITVRHWQYKNSQVTSLANFHVVARVLLTEHYWWGDEADVSPVDLTLGWRLMSNQDILDGLRLYNLRRAYAWAPRKGNLPAGQVDIATNSANMHMIPSTEELADRLRSIHRGDMVDVRGYLVEVKLPKGGIWRSSLTRTDTGNGACELVWVNDVTKL